ncbi:MAG: 2-amino-4-hydroxy-6-hydroxymethyldihydropteridine diphosphokinase [Bdellovibrionales bacterium GWA2_49_15]|nr:MAG: 2-amino-4-hydroxy-6-hydroxymethyldihydropteridine diphosphokinase [Bdellovibrionales bacterium GWA2_49_15]
MLALGTNLGNKAEHLRKAIANIRQYFEIKEVSRIYRSNPIGYLPQPNFYNLVILCNLPATSPQTSLAILQKIELNMGRTRDIPQGPRIIDIDILFFDTLKLQTPELTLPHPQWHLRPFTVYPLMELSAYNEIKINYPIWPLPERQGLMPVGYA